MSATPAPGSATASARRAAARRLLVLLVVALFGVLVPAPLRGGAALALIVLASLVLVPASGRTRRGPRRRRPSRDALTGLADAHAFRAFVHAELDHAAPALAILLLELRQVALLRSTFGRAAVETLCHTVATRLRRTVRAEDGLAHFGDGLFAVALRGVRDPASFEHAAARLRQEIAEPLLVAGTRVRPSWNAAGVITPRDGRTGSELLAAAEAAREVAAAEPGEPLRRLSADSRSAAEDRSRRQRELLEAVESRAFFPLFQPQLDLVTGAVERAEVLMRWQRTDGEVSAPGAFLHQLRELDALPQVSDEIYATAFAEAAAWRAAGAPLTRLALNLDASQVVVSDWAERLLALVERGPLPAAAVELEVSENILEQADAGRLVAGLGRLRRAGVSVSLDDFGTGYASLAQIADLPIDLVKLDARLLWDAAEAARTRLVIEGIVALMRKLELPCILEGVETPAQLALARRLGARWAQGYLIGRPVAAPELEARLIPARPLPRPVAVPLAAALG